LYFFQRSFGLDGKHVVNIIANNVRICCGRAVFAASPSEVCNVHRFQEEEEDTRLSVLYFAVLRFGRREI
jgi:hypothetical protein